MTPVAPWKRYQRAYNRLVREHGDAVFPNELYVKPVCLEDALDYVTHQRPELIYPIKSYMVAIIYATLLAEHYQEPFYKTLDDPDLFLKQDPFYTTYSQDPQTYDSIIRMLEDIPDWLNGGWCPKTKEYFEAECTLQGLEKAMTAYGV